MSTDLAEARRRADAMGRSYEELREAAEAAVVRWAWATSGAGFQRLRPLYAERFAPSDRRWLEGAPDADADADEYGFDADDRIVVVREHGGGVVHYEEFLEHGRDAVIAHRYRAGREPVGCRICRLRAGRVVHHVDAHAAGGFSVEHYGWEGERVVCIRHVFDYRTSEHARAQGASVHSVSYDERGRVAEIVEVADNGTAA